MTLYKQLVAGMIAVFLMLMASVFVIEFNTTRINLEQQQRSEVSNTINTVGLALAPYLENKDQVAVESVINALFDGSSYSVVRLVFLDSGEEIVRSYPIHPSSVPKWFSNLNLFSKIHDRRVVTSGWMQLAEVEIVSHPGSAYSQLWKAFVRLSFAFSVIFIIGIAAIAFILKRALRPLQLIVTKMEQVAKNQFGQPLPRPQTQDLIYVVDGINRMSAQVEKSFKAQAKEAQMLRERAYIDPVSKLGNRAYYMNQLNAWLGDGGSGGIAILEASFIKDLYDEKGYEAGDGMVQEVAAQLQVSITASDVVIARMSSNEFSFIFPNMTEEQLKQMANSIMAYVHNLNADPLGFSAENIALGVVYTQDRQTTTDVLSMLDNALAIAKAEPELEFGFIAAHTSQHVMGRSQWKHLVEEAISNDWIEFRLQSANNAEGQSYHSEVFSTIKSHGQTYRANQYLFALEELNASHLFDQYVIRTLLNRLEEQQITTRVAINISAASIAQPSFIRWIGNELSKHKDVISKLHFEIPESAFIHTPHHTALFCSAVREAGADFGVDNYGRHFQSLDYINEFRPAYVKLDYLFTHHLDDEKQKFTLTSISRTAHDLGIVTIASRVETQTQLNFLSQHFIDVFQGFIVDN
ncbi:EAL domain-containing protein [Vibrio sp. AK197]